LSDDVGSDVEATSKLLIDLILFSWGIIAGIITCWLWAEVVGPDKELQRRYKIPSEILHAIHHWQFGIILITIVTILKIVYILSSHILGSFILGVGLSIFLEDYCYHLIERIILHKK